MKKWKKLNPNDYKDGPSWVDIVQSRARIVKSPANGYYIYYSKFGLDQQMKIQIEQKAQKLSLAKYEFTVCGMSYIAQQCKGGEAIVTAKTGRFTTKSYSWDDVLENVRIGAWKLVKVHTKENPGNNSNIMNTPEKVEVGDTIVFFHGSGSVERRSKGTVTKIKRKGLGHGMFESADGRVIDNSTVGMSGLYIVKKAEKPKFSAKDAAIGTIMSNFNGNYLNIKTGHNKWQEIVDNALNDDYATMSDAFIQEAFDAPEQHHPAIVFQP